MIIDKTPLAFDSVANGVSIYSAKYPYLAKRCIRYEMKTDAKESINSILFLIDQRIMLPQKVLWLIKARFCRQILPITLFALQ